MSDKLGYRVIHLKDQEYPVLFNMRSLGDAERIIGMDVPTAISQHTGINTIAALLQAGLNEARRVYRLGGKRVTEFGAKDLMDEIGFIKTTQILAEAVGEVISYESAEDDIEDEDPEKK